tara:strand:+ start:270 stop:1019 length:750 start_codon:yes stop_codon:yes gene_type:complete
MELIEAGWELEAQVFCGSTIIDSSKSSIDSNYCLNNERAGDKETVITNRNRLQNLIGASHVVWMKQVHGNRVVEVGASDKAELPDTDACWTREQGIGLAVLTADCLPIVIASEKQDWLGIAHAGWKGLASGVIGELISCYPSSSSELVGWIGPSISKINYEVGREVWSLFDERHSENVLRDSFDFGVGKRLLNLVSVAESQLNQAGVDKLFSSDLCSYSDSRFFSARRFQRSYIKRVDGRLATVALLQG